LKKFFSVIALSEIDWFERFGEVEVVLGAERDGIEEELGAISWGSNM